MRMYNAHMDKLTSRRPRVAGRKRALNVSVREDLIEEAKAFKTNVSAVVEKALEEAHRERRREEWRRKNAKAVAAWNDWVEENGIPFAELRPW
jgi:antitoxin CcdA